MATSDWFECPLACVCSSIDYGYTASAVAEAVGPKFLRITDIVTGHIDWKQVPHVAVHDAILSKFRLDDDDIVVARTGASTGTSAYIKDPPDAVFASYLVRLKMGPAADARFVAYYLKSDRFWHFLRGVLGDKSAQPNASASTMTQAPFRAPQDVGEQRAIAHILATLDDKIDLNRRMSETLEAMARAIFQSWFVDFEPVRSVMSGNNIPASLINLLPKHFVDSPIGKIPEGWNVSTLGEVATEFETGGRPSGGASGTGVPSIGAESIVGLARFDFAKTKYVPESYFRTMTKGVVKSRDVLLYKDGGRPGEFEPHVAMFGDGFPFSQCAINEHVYRLRVAAPLTQNFAFFWLSSELALSEMRVKGTGVAIPGLNSSNAKSLSILIPAAPVVEAFEHLVEPVVAKVFAQCNQSVTLAKLRDTLLPRLISGDLRVKDAEKALEALA